MSTIHTPASKSRLDLANRLFREYYSQCFWRCRPDLAVTEARIALIVKGLRSHGGRKGLLEAARLTSLEAASGAC